jgi:hypothetical protein
MLPQYKITAKEFIELFKKVYKSPPVADPIFVNADNLTLFMCGDKSVKGVLDKIADKVSAKVEKELLNVDHIWFYTYDKESGKIDPAVDRPRRAIVAIEHHSDPGDGNFLKNWDKLMLLDIALKVVITYTEDWKRSDKYRISYVKQTSEDIVRDASDTNSNEYLLCLGDGWLKKYINWYFFIYDHCSHAFAKVC